MTGHGSTIADLIAEWPRRHHSLRTKAPPYRYASYHYRLGAAATSANPEQNPRRAVVIALALVVFAAAFVLAAVLAIVIPGVLVGRWGAIAGSVCVAATMVWAALQLVDRTDPDRKDVFDMEDAKR